MFIKRSRYETVINNHARLGLRFQEMMIERDSLLDKMREDDARIYQLERVLRAHGVSVPPRYRLPIPNHPAGATFIGPKRNY